MQTLLAEGKYAQLEQYLNEMTVEKLTSLDEIQTGNSLMDYIINQKIGECRKHNIKVYTEILIPQQLKISEDALCTILLNLLDNAIYASKEEDNADIHIKIHCVQSYLVIKNYSGNRQSEQWYLRL